VDLILRGSQDADTLGGVGGSNTGRLTGSMFSTEMLRVLSEARNDRDNSGAGRQALRSPGKRP